MRKKVLATSMNTGGVNAIVPVIKKFKEDGKVDVVTVATNYEYSQKAFRKGNVEFKALSSYNINDSSFDSIDKLLKQEMPDFVLTGTSVPEKDELLHEQAVIFSAKNKNIKSVSVLDFWADCPLRFNYSEGDFKFLPDKIAIIDSIQEKIMLKDNFPKDRLVITGNPHFDNLEKKARDFTEEQRYLLRKNLGLKADVAVFYAGGMFKKDRERFGYWDLDNLLIINEAIQNHKKDADLLVKLHPMAYQEAYKGDLEEITDYLKNSPQSKIVNKEMDAQELALSSDLTITHYSTVGIEALYMKKPFVSIQPNLKEQNRLSFLTENNIIDSAYNEEDCKKLVKNAIENKNYREFLKEKASSFRTDGKATERVANLVYDMMGVK